jgi:uncharacterized delta-60 repeat protein
MSQKAVFTILTAALVLGLIGISRAQTKPPGSGRVLGPPISITPELDPTFGIKGKVTTDFGFGRDDQALSVAIQADGDLVVAGRASIPNNGTDFALARFNPDGTLDTSFGGGIVTTDFFAGNDRATGVVVQSDGKIVTGGDAFNTNTGNTDLALARYNADGSLDTTFGVAGRVTTDLSINDLGNALVLQPDGKLILAGSILDSRFTKDFCLVRYNADGSLDPSFGVGGKVTTDFFHNSDEISSVVLLPDGSILAAGFAGSNTTSHDFAIARYNGDGTLDTTFGIGGKATVDFFGRIDEARAVAVQPDGRIILAGSAFNGTTLADFGLARFNADGTLDTSFGSAGKLTNDFFRNLDEAQSAVVLSDGSIVAAGRAFITGSNSDFALVSFDPDGKPDAGFGSNGKVTTDFFGRNDQAFKMVVDSDGRLVVVGAATDSNFSQDFALARYVLQQSPILNSRERP